MDDALIEVSRDLRANLLEPHDESIQEVIDEETEEQPATGVLYIQVSDQTGVIARSGTLGAASLPLSPESHALAAADRTLIETGRGASGHPLRIITFSAHDQGIAYTIQVATPLKGVYDVLGRFLVAQLIAIPVLLVALAVLGYLSVGRAFAPVRRVVGAARRISAEDLSLRIPPTRGKDEIAELVDTFNDMLARLERSFERVKQFSSDAAHELKTPLTAIRGEIEVTLRKERDRSEYEEVLRSNLEEVAKLQRVIDDLLLLARIEDRQQAPELERTELDEVVLEAFEEASEKAGRNGITMALKQVDEVSVAGKAVLLKRMVTNLIENANKYNRPGGKVTVGLVRVGAHALLSVEDTGAGIPEEALPRIMDRFFQVDRDRSSETGGTGLGLALVKKVVEFHSGKVEVQSKVGAGTTFTITLPVADRHV